MTEPDGQAVARAARQSANLARHLNDQHSGTVLLLARNAPGGRPDATAAELTGTDDAGLVLSATTPDGTADLRLALPPGADVRTRIGALLAATPGASSAVAVAVAVAATALLLLATAEGAAPVWWPVQGVPPGLP